MRQKTKNKQKLPRFSFSIGLKYNEHTMGIWSDLVWFLPHKTHSVSVSVTCPGRIRERLSALVLFALYPFAETHSTFMPEAFGSCGQPQVATLPPEDRTDKSDRLPSLFPSVPPESQPFGSPNEHGSTQSRQQGRKARSISTVAEMLRSFWLTARVTHGTHSLRGCPAACGGKNFKLNVSCS